MEFIVQKVGMSRTLSASSVAVTLLKLINTKVCSINENGRALVSYPKGKKHNRSIAGNQKKYDLSKEFNTFCTLDIGNGSADGLDYSVITPDRIVKLRFKTKGRGFSGAMKRWNFAGGPAAHGSRFHRRLGSIGNREWPGRVQPGKKMAGHYGDDFVSVKSKIISFDEQSGIIAIKGSLAGPNGAYGRLFCI